MTTFMDQLAALTDHQCRTVAYLLADLADRGEPVDAERFARFIALATQDPTP